MLYLGIDIGKRNHVASLMQSDSTLLFKGFSFSNSIEGAQALLEKLPSDCSEIEIGLEATGHYWLSLYSFLLQHHFVVHVINPIQTDGWRKNMDIRKRKTDQIDSVLIADFIRYGTFLETSLMDENTMSLRNLTRFRNFLIGSVSELKQKTLAILDQIFPEYEDCFSDVFGKTSKQLLLCLSDPCYGNDVTSSKLEQMLDLLPWKPFAKRKLKQLTDSAQNSFGITFSLDSFYLQLRLLLKQISFIEQQIQEVEEEISVRMEKLQSPLATVPGVGLVIAATILGEIGDISKFSNASKLVAFAGLDAAVSQSGEYVASSGSMSKRGSPYLRKALFQAAFVASNHDPVFRAYYLKKRAEGKHHFVAIGAVARKLCHTIHAVLKNNTPYSPQF